MCNILQILSSCDINKILSSDRTAVQLKAHAHVVVCVTGLLIKVCHVDSDISCINGRFQAVLLDRSLVYVTIKVLKCTKTLICISKCTCWPNFQLSFIQLLLFHQYTRAYQCRCHMEIRCMADSSIKLNKLSSSIRGLIDITIVPFSDSAPGSPSIGDHLRKTVSYS